MSCGPLTGWCGNVRPGEPYDRGQCQRCWLMTHSENHRRNWKVEGPAVEVVAAPAKPAPARKAKPAALTPCPHRSTEPVAADTCRTCRVQTKSVSKLGECTTCGAETNRQLAVRRGRGPAGHQRHQVLPGVRMIHANVALAFYFLGCAVKARGYHAQAHRLLLVAAELAYRNEEERQERERFDACHEQLKASYHTVCTCDQHNLWEVQAIKRNVDWAADSYDDERSQRVERRQ